MRPIGSATATSSGALNFYKIGYKYNWYKHFWDDYILVMSGKLGYGNVYGTSSVFPFFKHYYAGGGRSVRGYKTNSLGVKEDKKVLGGNVLVLGRAEVLSYIPLVKDTLKSLRMSAFVDVGNVYQSSGDLDIDLGTLRYSFGISATWFSPLGAFSLSLAKPLDRRAGDEIQSLQFSVGSTL